MSVGVHGSQTQGVPPGIVIGHTGHTLNIFPDQWDHPETDFSSEVNRRTGQDGPKGMWKTDKRIRVKGLFSTGVFRHRVLDGDLLTLFPLEYTFRVFTKH